MTAKRILARLQHAQIALAVAAAGSSSDRETRLASAREQVRSLRAQLDSVPDRGVAAPLPAPATTLPAASTAPAVASAPAPATAPPFAPTHRVPPEGLPAWPTPDPAGPATPLAGGLEVELVRRIQDWAEVRATNGWSGWVDARRLVEREPPTT